MNGRGTDKERVGRNQEREGGEGNGKEVATLAETVNPAQAGNALLRSE